MPANTKRVSFYVCLLSDMLSVIPMLSLYRMISQGPKNIFAFSREDDIIY